MNVHELHPAVPRKEKKRVGRGIGSGHGKTSTRGHKGQKARAGGGKGPAFEGGQMPLQRRLPRKGFNNKRFATEYVIVNLDVLNQFAAGTTVTPELLLEKGVIAKLRDGVKILGDGEVTRALTVQAQRFSRAAAEKIVAAGGKAEVI